MICENLKSELKSISKNVNQISEYSLLMSLILMIFDIFI